MANKRVPTVKNYLKNVVYSVKYSVIEDTIKSSIPIVFETKENNAEFAKEIRDKFRHKQNFKTIFKNANDGEFYRYGNELLKNARDSLRTGKFYDKKREERSENKAFDTMFGESGNEGQDDLLNFDEFDKEANDDLSLDKLDNADAIDNLNSDLNDGLKNSADAIGESVLTGAEYTGEVIKKTSAIAYSQGVESLKALQSGFAMVSSGFKNIMNFNTTAMKTHFENSQKYFDSATKLLTDQNAMLKEMLEMQRNLYNKTKNDEKEGNKNDYNEIFGSGIDLKAYSERIKKNFLNSDLISPLAMFWDFRDMILANPLQFISQALASNILGTDRLKESLSKLNSTLMGSIGKGFEIMHKKAKDSTIWNFLDQVFNIRKRNETTTLDTSKFEKGPMQFNGIANKAITEVIPGYLARIEAALTGNEERYFNMRSGKWQTVTDIRREVNEGVTNARKSGISSVTSRIRSGLSKFDINGYYRQEGNSQSELMPAINKLINYIQENEGMGKLLTAKFKRKDGTSVYDPKILADVLGIGGYSTATKRLIATLVSGLTKDDWTEAYHEIRTARGGVSDWVANHSKLENGNFILTQNDTNKGANFRGLPAGIVGGSTGTGYSSGVIQQLPEISARYGYMGRIYDPARIYQMYRTPIKPTGPQIKYATRNTNTIGTFNEGSLGNVDYSKDISVNVTREDIEKDDKSGKKELSQFLSVLANYASITDIGTGTSAEKTAYKNAATKYLKHLAERTSSDIPIIDNLIQYLKAAPNTINEMVSTKYSKLRTKYLVYRDVLDQLFVVCGSTSANSNKYTSLNDLAKYMSNDGDTLEDSRDAYEEYEGKSLSEKLSKAKGIEKAGVLINFARHYTSAPFDILAKTVSTVDEMMYRFFFEDEAVDETKYGRKIKGFFGRLNFELGNSFDRFNEWFKKRIFNTEIKDKYLSSLKTTGSNIGHVLKNSFSEILFGGEKEKKAKESSSPLLGFLGNTTDEDNLLSAIKLTDEQKKEFTKGKDNAKTSFTEEEIKQGTKGAAGGLGYIPKTGMYMLSKGEAVIPSTMNPSNPWRGKTTIAQDAANEKRVGRNMGIHVINGYAAGTKNNEQKEEEKKEQTAFDELKRLYPSMLGEGTVYGAIGGLLGGPFGLILGASFGAANNILKKSSIVSKTVFGDEKKLSLITRAKNGLSSILPNEVINSAKNKLYGANDIKNFGIAGGALGAASALVGGPLGIVGGIAVGSVLGMIKHSTAAQETLFGTGATTAKLKRFFNKKYMKSLGLGGVAGSVLFGGPLGLIGGMMMGGAIKFASESDNIKDFLFGKKDPKTGKRDTDNGFLGKLSKKILMPFNSLSDNINNYLKEALFQPLKNVLTPMQSLLNMGVRGVIRNSTRLIEAIINPRLKLNPFQRIIRYATTTDAGKFLSGSVGGGLIGGMAVGGPTGAVLGAILGGILRSTGFDKWVAKQAIRVSKWPGKIVGGLGNWVNKKLINQGKADNMTAAERLAFMKNHKYTYSNKTNMANDITLAKKDMSKLALMKAQAEILRSYKSGNKISKNKINQKIRDILWSNNFTSDETNAIYAQLKLIYDNPDNKDIIKDSTAEIMRVIDESSIDPDNTDAVKSSIKGLISILAGTGKASEVEQKALRQNMENITKVTGYKFNGKDSYEDLSKFSRQIEAEYNLRKAKGEKEPGNANAVNETIDTGDIALIKEAEGTNERLELTNNLLTQIYYKLNGQTARDIKPGEMTSIGKALDAQASARVNTAVEKGVQKGKYLLKEDINRKMDTFEDELSPSSKQGILAFSKLNGNMLNYIRKDFASFSNSKIKSIPNYNTVLNYIIEFGSTNKIPMGSDVFKVLRLISKTTDVTDKGILNYVLSMTEYEWDIIHKEVKTACNKNLRITNLANIYNFLTSEDIGYVPNNIVFRNVCNEVPDGTTTDQVIEKCKNSLITPDTGGMTHVTDKAITPVNNTAAVEANDHATAAIGKAYGTISFPYMDAIGMASGTAAAIPQPQGLPTESGYISYKRQSDGGVGPDMADKNTKETVEKIEQKNDDIHTLSEGVHALVEIAGRKKDKIVDKAKEKGKGIFETIKDFMTGGGLFKLVTAGISGIPLLGGPMSAVLKLLGPKMVGRLFKAGGISLILYEAVKRLFSNKDDNSSDTGLMSFGSDSELVSNTAARAGLGATKKLFNADGIAKSIAHAIAGYMDKCATWLEGVNIPIVRNIASSFASRLRAGIKKLDGVGATFISAKLSKKLGNKLVSSMAAKILKGVLQTLTTPVGSAVVFAGIGFFNAGETFGTDSPTILQRFESAFLNGIAAAIPVVGIFMDGSDLLSLIRLIIPGFWEDAKNDKNDQSGDASGDSDDGNNGNGTTPETTPGKKTDDNSSKGFFGIIGDKISSGLNYLRSYNQSNRPTAISKARGTVSSSFLNRIPVKSYAKGTIRGYAGGTSDNGAYIWNYLKSKGFSSNAIAGIMGNMMQESGLVPNIVEGGTTSETIVPGKGYGLCQWTYPSRQDALENFASQRGTSVSDIDTQLDFLLSEMDAKSGLNEKLNAAGSPSEAATIFHDEMEGSADATMDKREGFAEQAAANEGKGMAFSGSRGSSSGAGGRKSGIGGFFGAIDNAMLSMAKPFMDVFGDVLGIGGSSSNGSGGKGGSSSGGGASGYGVKDGLRGSGFDDKYIEVNGPEEQTSLIPVKDIVKQKFNGMAKEYFEQTGNKLMITGAAENGPHASGTYSHPAGWKLDVAKPLSNPELFANLGNKYDVAIGDEDSAHYDLGFGAANVGGTPITNVTPDGSKYPDGKVPGAAAGTVTGMAAGTVGGVIDYSDKLDTLIQNQNILIQLFTQILNVVSSTSGNANTANDSTAAQTAGMAAPLTGAVTRKMTTSTPGQSIMDIMKNMLTVATT